MNVIRVKVSSYFKEVYVGRALSTRFLALRSRLVPRQFLEWTTRGPIRGFYLNPTVDADMDLNLPGLREMGGISQEKILPTEKRKFCGNAFSLACVVV